MKHKTQHSCESTIYFDLGTDISKENCEFQHYLNKTDVKPSVLDDRHEIILANWPITKYVTCNDNHNYPIKIPSHLYVLLKRTVLCNCTIHVENHFLLESIAACPGKQSALAMYYTVNTAFMQYFDSLKEDLEITELDAYISKNWTTQEQVIPISLQTLEIDSKLLKASEMLKDLIQQYKQKRQALSKENKNKNDTKRSFFNNIMMDIFLFVAAILSMIATAVFVHLVCRHTKLKALLTGIFFQPVKQTEAIFYNDQMQKHCTAQWYTIAALTLMIITLTIYICLTMQNVLYSKEGCIPIQ